MDATVHVRLNPEEYDWLGKISAKLRAPRSAVVRAIVRDFQRRSVRAGKVLIELGEVELDIA